MFMVLSGITILKLLPNNLRGEWLGELYSQAVKMLDDAEGEEKVQFQQEVSQILQKLEAKDKEFIHENGK